MPPRIRLEIQLKQLGANMLILYCPYLGQAGSHSTMKQVTMNFAVLRFNENREQRAMPTSVICPH